MADYDINEIIRQVKAAILAESQGVGEIPVVSSLDGINSLPTLRNGNEVVEAPIVLLRQPAEEAAARADEAAANAQDTADHPTYVGTDNYVYAWDKNAGAYNKTDIYVRGEGFKISKEYESVEKMEADTKHGLKEGDFVLINTNDVENPDNAKIYVVTAEGKFKFLVDISGAIGFTGKTPQFSIGTITIGVNRADAGVTLSDNGFDDEGNPRYKLNIKIPSVHLSDLSDAEIALLQSPANEMIAQLEATDQEVNENEVVRQEQESVRQSNEIDRVSNENERVEHDKVSQNNEALRIENENTRIANEDERVISESTRASNEGIRQTNETARQQTKAEMEALNQELKEHPPIVNDSGKWEVWDAIGKAYVDTGKTALGRSPVIVDNNWWNWNTDTGEFEDSGKTAIGKSPKIVDGKWWVWNTETGAFEDTGVSVSSDYDDSALTSKIQDLQSQIDTLVSGSASDAIESFNEIMAFLSGVEDTETLEGIIAAINTSIASKADKTTAITNITRSGTTFTATRADGTTFTFSQQDNNTTYTNGTGLDLSGTTFSVKYGTTAGTACQGDDSRLSNARPASDVYSWAKASSKPSYTWSEIGSKPSFATVATSGKYSDLSGTPTIPTNNNQLANGAGYITGITKAMVTAALGYTPPTADTDTHYTTRIYAGASGTAANASATNPYIKITDNNTYRNQIRLVGGGATTVTSDASGNITISSTNTTYSAATTSAAGLMSAADKTKVNNAIISDGTITKIVKVSSLPSSPVSTTLYIIPE